MLKILDTSPDERALLARLRARLAEAAGHEEDQVRAARLNSFRRRISARLSEWRR